MSLDRQRHRAEKHQRTSRLEAEAELQRAVIAATARASKPRSSSRRCRGLPSSCFSGAGMRDASIGVSVSDTKAEATIDDRHHHRELVEDAADDAAHQQHRDEHGDQRDRRSR